MGCGFQGPRQHKQILKNEETKDIHKVGGI